jgi:hypothetical protein
MDWETYSALGLSSVGDVHSNNPGVEFEDLAARRAEAEADATYLDRLVNPNRNHESRARRPGVPCGRIIEHKGWASSTVYPGTLRDWWIYVPAQYDSTGPPAALLVCQDGNVSPFTLYLVNARSRFRQASLCGSKLTCVLWFFIAANRDRTKRSLPAWSNHAR